MSKFAWFVIALIAVLASVMVARARTANEDLRPYLGKWTGGFVADPADKRRDLLGFLQIYATGQTYKLQVAGEQQTINVEGTWTLSTSQIVLKPTSLSIDDEGGEAQRDPNLTFFPNPDIRTALNKPLALNLRQDGKRLEGLLLSIGKVQGTFGFDWGGSGR